MACFLNLVTLIGVKSEEAGRALYASHSYFQFQLRQSFAHLSAAWFKAR